jgi:2-dehydro-3-deoxyglucarate aldolase/4-hydroxy-2-oxoheptanedioate aldolase
MALTDAIRAAVNGGAPVVGTFVMEFATPGVGALAAAAGAEFVFFDQQHTGWSLGALAPSLWGCQAAGIPAGIRVPAAVPWMIGAALDAGAATIMVPAVDDADTARAIVRAVRYPPAGDRALTFGVASDRFRPPSDPSAEMRRRDAETPVFVQIETVAGLSNVDEIAAVDGIDVLWVGDNDLAAALGIPGEFGHERYLAALDKVAQAAQAAQIAAGFTTADPAGANDMLRRGYRILCCGNDIKVFQQALKSGIDEFRRVSPAAQPVE